MDSRVAIIDSGDPSNNQVAPRTQNINPGTWSMTPPLVNTVSEKKKRGRPRKYKPDESTSNTFPSVPISSSVPYAAGKSHVVEKLNFVQPINLIKKQKNKFGTEKLGFECSTGSSFLPHVITVNAGEDISTKIMEFSLQGPRTVCILSGNGKISNATIRRPGSSGDTLTYEGLFEIISFSGSFTPVEKPELKFGRSSMVAISLADADGRVMAGFIAGQTIAASPVKVVVASFLPGNSYQLKPKKQKLEATFAADDNASVPGSSKRQNLLL